MFVVIPGAVKIIRAIHSLLRDCPPPIGSSLVTKCIKGTWTSWIDCVNTADPWTGFVQLSTVLAVRSNNEDNNHNNTWKWVRGVNTRTRIENHNYMSPMSSCMSLILVFSFSSASFEWKAVFFRKFIGAARLDGRTSRVTESTRNSRAEPWGEKSSCSVKSLSLWYVIMPSYRLK